MDEFTSSGVKILFHAFKEDAFRLENDKRVQLQEFSAFREGLFEIQDLSSQCIGGTLLALPLPENARVLDYCAGGGGKSLQIASCIRKQKGKVFSWDIRSNKLEELRKRAAKAHLDNIHTLDRIPQQRAFDAVLLDVPCSGFGLLSEKPDVRLHKSESDIDALVKTQDAILNACSRYVRSGGVLVYATCTIVKRENGERIEAFLLNHPEFTPEEQRQLLPTRDGTDGFYYSRLRRS